MLNTNFHQDQVRSYQEQPRIHLRGCRHHLCLWKVKSKGIIIDHFIILFLSVCLFAYNLISTGSFLMQFVHHTVAPLNQLQLFQVVYVMWLYLCFLDKLLKRSIEGHVIHNMKNKCQMQLLMPRAILIGGIALLVLVKQRKRNYGLKC